MSNPIQIHEFAPVIYPYNLWIVINKQPHSLSGYFLEDDRSEIVFTDAENRKALAFAIPSISKGKGDYGVILYFRSKKSMFHL